MAKPVMQLEGMDELRKAFAQSPDLLRGHVSKGISRATFSATNRMKSMVTRDTGKLAQAISGEARALSGRVLIGAEAYYWRFVEYGTIHQNARPFVRPTAELETRDFERDMEQAADAFARDFSASRFL